MRSLRDFKVPDFKFPKFKLLNSETRIPVAHNSSKITLFLNPAGVSIFILFKICSTSSGVKNLGKDFGRLGADNEIAGFVSISCSLKRYL